jgi:hypothetical protein
MKNEGTLNDKVEVTILFHDPEINSIFAALVEGGDVVTSVPAAVPYAISHGTAKNTKIITEPDYLPMIPKELHGSCLVVGPAEQVRNLDTQTLSQPLTEEKVERALVALLAQ